MRATDDNAKWGVPDLSECVSDKMAELTQQVKQQQQEQQHFLNNNITLIVRINLLIINYKS